MQPVIFSHIQYEICLIHNIKLWPNLCRPAVNCVPLISLTASKGNYWIKRKIIHIVCCYNQPDNNSLVLQACFMLFVSVILTFLAQSEFCICIQNHYRAWVKRV